MNISTQHLKAWPAKWHWIEFIVFIRIQYTLLLIWWCYCDRYTYVLLNTSARTYSTLFCDNCLSMNDMIDHVHVNVWTKNMHFIFNIYAYKFHMLLLFAVGDVFSRILYFAFRFRSQIMWVLMWMCKDKHRTHTICTLYYGLPWKFMTCDI